MQLFDETIALAQDYYWEMLPQAKKHVKEEDDDSLSFNAFPKRSCEGMRSIYQMFDVHEGINSLPETMADEVVKKGVEALPESLKPGAPLPANTYVQLIIHKVGDDNYSVLKHFMFEGGLKTAEALKLALGSVSTLPYKPHSTWSIKKAVQMMLDRIPGTHVQWVRVGLKKKAAAAKGGAPK